MTPIHFPDMNLMLADDQPQFLLAPAHLAPDGTVTTCWEMTQEEYIELAKTRCIWVRIRTDGRSIQPQTLGVWCPIQRSVQ